MTNFDFLKKEKRFKSFADAAIAAEKTIHIDLATCVISCRRAMEFAVKWMYTVDEALEKPYQDKLISLMSTEEFEKLVDENLRKQMHYIRTTGNSAAHTKKKITWNQAVLCLKNLHAFMCFIAHCYGENFEEKTYDETLLVKSNVFEERLPRIADTLNMQMLTSENRPFKKQFTERRQMQQPTYVPESFVHTEYETRKLYIDALLEDAGWQKGKDWMEEVPVAGMPNKSGVGYADYILYDDSHKPLAVIEAKSTSRDLAQGRQQAKLYADCLEKKYGRRPFIFLTNGFEIRITDNQYPERKTAAFYSKRDLEKVYNLRTMRTSLKNIRVDKNIAGRYYQEGAIKAVCHAFDQKNRRKALLVMATGAGKTRTAIALCKVLVNAGWVKNILFLADRTTLVTQAKRSFMNLYQELSVTNLCEESDHYNAHCVLSTYQTMIHCIDSVKDEKGKLFTCGHFDLVICDEAHRSIYNKYRDIFTYFDAPLVGLTATPKDDIDKNTYDFFDLENNVPTYGYDLAQAVKDGYLVDYLSVETKLKFIEQGIVYDELSQEDKEEYENTFKNEDGKIPEQIEASALNTWIFNEDTIKQVLHILMTEGIHTEYGSKLGKTIIFAKNHKHAEKILEVFHKEYPGLPDYARVIDTYLNYAQSAVDDFSNPAKMPQIAISVDMLDTGVDIPEIVNLVFFKKVMSKAKFWQMIGRGTRLCEKLIDGEDKKHFYIFDFCGNFEFFRMNQGKPTANMLAVQGAIFNLEFQLVYKLQDIRYQEKRLMAYRSKLVDMLVDKVQELNRENFSVRQHIEYVDKYAKKENYNGLEYKDTLMVKEELAPLILPDQDEVSAVRFDALMFGIELCFLIDQKYNQGRKDLMKRVKAIANVANIPEIQGQTELIQKILYTDYLETAGIYELENIRLNLRNLMKYISNTAVYYDTHFDDDLLSMEWKESQLNHEELKDYKAKAEYYIRRHQDQMVVAKLKTNLPLTKNDIDMLESILWSEVGTKEEYEKEYGKKPLGEFVREIVGLDMNAAKEAFSEFLEDTEMDSRQIYFVNQIIEYIVHNGIMNDLSVLQEEPFINQGSVAEIFTDLNVWEKVRRTIEQINKNAAA